MALVRHARAPGTGDPPGFRLGDCATQRNLSDEGRHMARRLGRRFRAEGVAVASVRSSRWCRAMDTAALAFPEAEITPEPALDSNFGRNSGAETETADTAALVARWSGRAETLVLVTHQVNILALTSVPLAEGEVVVVRPTRAGPLNVVGKLRP
nr:histidine phosphatase family protein [Enterovirga sp.]